MKKLILVITLLFSFGALAETVATCKDSILPVGESENGSMAWGKAHMNMTVSKTGSKYTAVINFRGQVMKVNEGIEVTDFTGTEALGEMIEVLKMANLPYKKVAGGTYYNLHPEANRDDAAGFSLTVLKDKSGSIVGKIFQAGWGVGVCK